MTSTRHPPSATRSSRFPLTAPRRLTARPPWRRRPPRTSPTWIASSPSSRASTGLNPRGPRHPGLPRCPARTLPPRCPRTAPPTTRPPRPTGTRSPPSTTAIRPSTPTLSSRRSPRTPRTPRPPTTTRRRTASTRRRRRPWTTPRTPPRWNRPRLPHLLPRRPSPRRNPLRLRSLRRLRSLLRNPWRLRSLRRLRSPRRNPWRLRSLSLRLRRLPPLPSRRLRRRSRPATGSTCPRLGPRRSRTWTSGVFSAVRPRWCRRVRSWASRRSRRRPRRLVRVVLEGQLRPRERLRSLHPRARRRTIGC